MTDELDPDIYQTFTEEEKALIIHILERTPPLSVYTGVDDPELVCLMVSYSFHNAPEHLKALDQGMRDLKHVMFKVSADRRLK